jgi:hypothetical protein
MNRISGLFMLRQVLHTQTNLLYGVTNFMTKGFCIKLICKILRTEKSIPYQNGMYYAKVSIKYLPTEKTEGKLIHEKKYVLEM